MLALAGCLATSAQGQTCRVMPTRGPAPFIAVLRRADGLAADVVQRAFIGPLVEVLAEADGAREIRARALRTRFRQCPDSAFAMGRRELRRRLQSFTDAMPTPSSEMYGFRSVESESADAHVQASRLLLAEDWLTASEDIGPALIVAAPFDTELFFGPDSLTPVSRRDTLPANAVMEMMARAIAPYARRDARPLLGDQVLRWRDGRWSLVPRITPEVWQEYRRLAEARKQAEYGPADSVTHVTTPAAPPVSAPAMVKPPAAAKGAPASPPKVRPPIR
jgi:hypothetical protein